MFWRMACSCLASTSVRTCNGLTKNGRLMSREAGLLIAVSALMVPHASNADSSRSSVIEAKIDHVIQTYTLKYPSAYGPKADEEIDARLKQAQADWVDYRNQRCGLVSAGFDNSYRSEARCKSDLAQKRLNELLGKPDEFALKKIHLLDLQCSRLGSMLDQTGCYGDYLDAELDKIKKEGAAHFDSDKLVNVWYNYASSACLRDFYYKAPVHPPSQGWAIMRCQVMRETSDLSFVEKLK